MNTKDYYEILEVRQEATTQEIKESYRKLAFQYHPDRNNGDPSTLERMKVINEAYAVLSNPAKRQQYDNLRCAYGDSASDRFRQNHTEEDIFRGSDINRVFEEMARSFGFRGFEDVFQAAYGSGFRTFEFSRGGMFGRGFIFSGVPGQNKVSGAAASHLSGVFSGFLGKLVSYALKKATGFELPHKGKDRFEYITIQTIQARRGGKVPYNDRFHSRNLMITIPPGVVQGQVIRLRGLGHTGSGSAEPGDLYLKVEIKEPFLRKIRNFLKS